MLLLGRISAIVAQHFFVNNLLGSSLLNSVVSEDVFVFELLEHVVVNLLYLVLLDSAHLSILDQARRYIFRHNFFLNVPDFIC